MGLPSSLFSTFEIKFTINKAKPQKFHFDPIEKKVTNFILYVAINVISVFLLFTLCLHFIWISNKLTKDIRILLLVHIKWFKTIYWSMESDVKYFKALQWNQNGIMGPIGSFLLCKTGWQLLNSWWKRAISRPGMIFSTESQANRPQCSLWSRSWTGKWI